MKPSYSAEDASRNIPRSVPASTTEERGGSLNYYVSASPSSCVLYEGIVSVKKVASNRLLSGTVWKRRYCVLNAIVSNGAAVPLLSSSLSSDGAISASINVSSSAADASVSPDVVGTLLIYKLPKRPTGPEDILHDSIAIRESTLLVKEASTKQPILHIVTQDGHAMMTKSLQFDTASDLDTWKERMQALIDRNADDTVLTAPTSTAATAVAVVASVEASEAEIATNPESSTIESNPDLSLPSSSTDTKRTGVGSPKRLVSIAASLRSLSSSNSSNKDGGATKRRGKNKSPSGSPKGSRSPVHADDSGISTTAEANRFAIATVSVTNDTGAPGTASVSSIVDMSRALRSLSASSDDSAGNARNQQSNGTDISSNPRRDIAFSTPAVAYVATVKSSVTSGRDEPSSDARPSRGGINRGLGSSSNNSSRITDNTTPSGAMGGNNGNSSRADDNDVTLSTRRGPSLRRGSSGNNATTFSKPQGILKPSSTNDGLATPISATPVRDTALPSPVPSLPRDVTKPTTISNPNPVAPAVTQAAERLDVPALAAPRVDVSLRDTPKQQLKGRFEIAGPSGLGTSMEFGASTAGRLPLHAQKTSSDDTFSIRNRKDRSSSGSGMQLPSETPANMTAIDIPMSAISYSATHPSPELSPPNLLGREQLLQSPLKSNNLAAELFASTSKAPLVVRRDNIQPEVKTVPQVPSAAIPSQSPAKNINNDEYSLYALELEALKQMNGELNSALVSQEKKFALDTANMQAQLRILTESEATLKAKYEALETQRVDWVATEARLSKQIAQLTAEVEERRRDAAVMGAPTTQLDADHVMVVHTLNAELTMARNEIVRLRAEAEENTSKYAALSTSHATNEEALRVRDCELKEAQAAVLDYRNQLDELRHRLRGSLNSKMDLQSRLSAEMHEELMGDTARMLSVEKEKAALEASLELCRNEVLRLSKDNEDLKAKLTLKDMYLTALSKESQEGKIKFLEEELSQLRSEVSNTEAQKRRATDELEASQKAQFDERSKYISLSEESVLLRSQLRQKESELAVAESDASNRTRHLTLEISRLNDDVALLTRQLESQRMSCEKSDKSQIEQQSRYMNEKAMWSRSNSELQQSLEAAQSTVHSLQSRLSATQDESKHEISRLTNRNRELEETCDALNQSIGTLRQKVSSTEHHIETLQQSVSNQTSTISTLESTIANNDLSYKRDLDRYQSKVSELQTLLDKSQQGELEAKRRVSDMEIQRCNDEMHLNLSNQDLTSKLASLTKDLAREKEESTTLRMELSNLKVQSNDSAASLRNTIARLEDSKKTLERDLQDAMQRLGMATRRSEEMAEELTKLTTLAGEAVRTRVELEDASHRLISAQRRIEELLIVESQHREALKEAAISKHQAENREIELTRLLESAEHDVEDLKRRWLESQSLCDAIAKERDELESECSAANEAVAELDARLTTWSRQCEELKANNKNIAEQSTKRQKALKRSQSAVAELQEQLAAAGERESALRDECNDLKAKLAASRMEQELAVSHSNSLLASVESSRHDCSVLSDALMFAKTESSNLLALKDGLNAELSTRIKELEGRLNEMGLHMDGMISKDIHSASEQRWRELSAHYDERFKECDDQFSAAALIIEGCCSRLSRSLVHDDLRDVAHRIVSDNNIYSTHSSATPATSSPDARLRIALESLQQCADSIIDASISASGAVVALLKDLLVASSIAKVPSERRSSRGSTSGAPKLGDNLESSFDEIDTSVDEFAEDLFSATNVSQLPYLGITMKLIKENSPFLKERSPRRRSRGPDGSISSPGAVKTEPSGAIMGLVLLTGSVKEASELLSTAAARRKQENDRINLKKSQKYRSMKESLSTKIEALRRALDSSLSSHETETEQLEAQVAALKSLSNAAVSERDELKIENSNYAVQIMQMKNEIATLTFQLRQSASELQQAEHSIATESKARKELENLLRQSISMQSQAVHTNSFSTNIEEDEDDDRDSYDGADSSVSDNNRDHIATILNEATVVASHDGRFRAPSTFTASLSPGGKRGINNTDFDRTSYIHIAETKSSSPSSMYADFSPPIYGKDDAKMNSYNDDVDDSSTSGIDVIMADNRYEKDEVIIDNNKDDSEPEEVFTMSAKHRNTNIIAEAKSSSRNTASSKETKYADVTNTTTTDSGTTTTTINTMRRSNLKEWMESKTEYKPQAAFTYGSDDSDDSSSIAIVPTSTKLSPKPSFLTAPSKIVISKSTSSNSKEPSLTTSSPNQSDDSSSDYDTSRERINRSELKSFMNMKEDVINDGDAADSGSESSNSSSSTTTTTTSPHYHQVGVVEASSIGKSAQVLAPDQRQEEGKRTSLGTSTNTTNTNTINSSGNKGSYLRTYHQSRSQNSSGASTDNAVTNNTNTSTINSTVVKSNGSSSSVSKQNGTPTSTSTSTYTSTSTNQVHAPPRMTLRERLNLHRGGST